MLIAAAAALAIAAGLSPIVIAAGALAVWQPVVLLIVAAGWAAWRGLTRRNRGPLPDQEAVFFRLLAAEVAAGASLRTGLVVAAGAAPGPHIDKAIRLAQSGSPMAQVADELRVGLPINGTLAAAAITAGARSGGHIVSILRRLAERASRVGELERERRALTAQARLSAWVVGGAPAALLLMLAGSGRLPSLSDPAGLAIIAVGGGLELVGVAVVWMMLRSAS